MARTGLELISMADIARLAGQSRATVGNWKARNPDFPPERGRGARGPLYDRAEVTQWLESTNRLDKRPEEVAAMWQVADQLRGSMTMQDALPLILVLLAVMSKSSPEDWQRIRQAPPWDLDTILRSSALTLFPFAEELIPRGRLPAEPLLRVVEVLSQFDRPDISAMADALLEHAAQAMGKQGGEYLSPPSVRKLVVALAEPVGSVYNPASGIGQLMVDAAVAAEPDEIELFGQEINVQVWAMARLNLAIHGVHTEIALGDVFRDDYYPQLRAQRVVAVPPWNQKLRILDDLVGDPRWVWGEPGPNDSNAAWIQHCLYHLADGGRAVIVMANRALFERGRAGRIRQRIIKAGLLDAVLALPPGLFQTTSLACSVLVFVKGRPRANGKPAPTLMVDLRNSSEGRASRSASLGDNVIAEAARLYHSWAAGEEPASRIAAVTRYNDLADNDFVIDPGRYVAVPPAASDLDEVVDERSALVDKLERLSQVSRVADDHLKAILEAHR
jgi:type I restriction-modification system DNA methylase subunit/predicted DNA-binding transcriptional regulator AlpA